MYSVAPAKFMAGHLVAKSRRLYEGVVEDVDLAGSSQFVDGFALQSAPRVQALSKPRQRLFRRACPGLVEAVRAGEGGPESSV